MRVFVSSTGEDLRDHRKALIDAILRRDWTPVVMEHFGGDPRRNLQMCEERVRSADVTVAFVAHRYGSPVPPEEGGDARHGYTWYEVQASKTLFGYLVDPVAPWTGRRETDALTVHSTPDELAAIRDRMRLLAELTSKLQTRSCGSFTTPDSLVAEVMVDLSRHADQLGGHQVAAPHVWAPRWVHALQPAPVFAGRETVLAELAAWWTDPGSPDRLMALVAPGGTGKTAIVEHHVRRAARPIAGLFVWSFYEDPDVDRFLREAAGYLLDRTVTGAGAVEAFKDGLRGELPHVIVLDGLERVQVEAQAGRVRGEIEDTRLKSLVRLVAAGALGRARMLVTTRFPLRDLDDWRGRGYRPIELADLDPAAARAVLRQWGVRGPDPAVDRAAARVGRHALSLAVLGSFLARYRDGDPAAADALDLELAAGDDPASGRLLRIVLSYRDALTPDERQVMGWLSTFPRGVEVALLGVLARDGRVGGVLIGCEDARLVAVLTQLERAGLVFRSGEPSALRWSAHPFLRDHFRSLLGVPEADVWAVAEAELARGLERRPAANPTEEAALDRYEALIEASRGAGRVDEAFELYWHALGSYRHLGGGHGEYTRGRRIAEAFLREGDGSITVPGLDERYAALLVGEVSLYRRALGDLGGARRSCEARVRWCRSAEEATELSIGLQNLADLEVAAGRLAAAAAAADEALAAARAAADRNYEISSLAYVAHAAALRGAVSLADARFGEATALEDKPRLYSVRGIQEAELHLRQGAREDARAQTEANLAIATRNGWGRDVALCHDVLGRCALPQDPTTARVHLAEVRDWGTRTGEIELVLRAHRLGAELALAERNAAGALTEAEEGLTVADGLGYRLFAIDLRTLAARATAEDPARSLPYARAALDAATDPEVGYAWGEADAAHMCGAAHLRLGEPDLARRRLAQALAVRQRIGHPGVARTERALGQLS